MTLPSSIPSCFQKRRDQLMRQFPQAAFLFPAKRECFRNSDVSYPYRQESFFYYLTGWEEPQSLLVLAPRTSTPGYQTILFVPPMDPQKVLWEGEMYGLEGARQIFGADEAFPFSEWKQRLPALLKQSSEWFYHWGEMPELDLFLPQMAQAKGVGDRGISIQDSWAAAGELRLHKSSEEQDWMRHGCKISAETHRRVMEYLKPGMNEREIEALIEWELKRHGCARLAYGSIVAGGRHATTLHYHRNDTALQEGDLVLIDAGGEYAYYSADITRTFPIGSRWTAEQAALYDLVLKVQKKAIQSVRPGISLEAIHQTVREDLTEGLIQLGFWKKSCSVSNLLKEDVDQIYYPHGTSHWLGMDVHDVGFYRLQQKPRPLAPGMVFTIEPGLYIASDCLSAPEKYRGIGIRIEDDLLVTETGYENLTSLAPKEREEIDALRNP